jgi:hypothetical protein
MKWIIATLIIWSWITAALCGDYVVIVNNNNPLSSVSAADLKRLYTGKLDNIDITVWFQSICLWTILLQFRF